MKISMTESGGFAALASDGPAAFVDTDRLPPDAAAEGKRLVAAARKAAAGAGNAPVPDGMGFHFIVDEDGAPASFKLSDADMGPEAAALMDWFQRHASA